MRNPWIDVSVPLRHGMTHWPGDPEVTLRRISSIAKGDVTNCLAMSMCVHTGTHVDAPLHFLRDGRGVDLLPLDTGIGPARVIAVRNRNRITVAELRPH